MSVGMGLSSQTLGCGTDNETKRPRHNIKKLEPNKANPRTYKPGNVFHLL